MRLTTYLLAYLLIVAVVGSFASSPVSGQGYQTLSFSLSGTLSSGYSCWYWAVRFNANQGQRFSVKWNETSDTPTSLELYIVAPSASRGWFCDTGPVDLYYNSGAYGSMNWAAPYAGEYIVLVVNDNLGSVSGTLSIMAVNATVTATPLGYAMARLFPGCLGIDCVGS